MYIAFRGMRNAGSTPQEDAGAAHDRANFIRVSPAYASWLPSTEMRVHTGVLDHHASVWSAGLREFIASLLVRCTHNYQPLDEIFFIGLSMGG